MKKNVLLLLVLTIGFVLTGCGGARDIPTNEITSLYDDGYSCMSTVATEDCWKGLFQSPDGSTILIVKAPLAANDYDKYTAIDFDDEDGKKAFLGGLKDIETTDVSDKIPSQEELDAYVGKTLGDLENDGFENTGYSGGDGIYTFFYDGPVYCCVVKMADGVVIDDMDNYSANDLRTLEIGAVECGGISSMLLDNM